MYKYKNAKKSQKSYKNIGCTKFIANLSAMIKKMSIEVQRTISVFVKT
jgi:hypothetical protein